MVDALDPGRIYGKSPTPSEHPFSIDAHFIMPGLEHFGSDRYSVLAYGCGRERRSRFDLFGIFCCLLVARIRHFKSD
jgi:hypothetical protein